MHYSTVVTEEALSEGCPPATPGCRCEMGYSSLDARMLLPSWSEDQQSLNYWPSPNTPKPMTPELSVYRCRWEVAWDEGPSACGGWRKEGPGGGRAPGVSPVGTWESAAWQLCLVAGVGRWLSAAGLGLAGVGGGRCADTPLPVHRSLRFGG